MGVRSVREEGGMPIRSLAAFVLTPWLLAGCGAARTVRFRIGEHLELEVYLLRRFSEAF